MAALLAVAAPAAAQSCASDGDRARVCSIRLYTAPPGERPREIDPRNPVVVPLGGELQLEIEALDERRRTFPFERLLFGLDMGYGCRDVVEIERRDEGHRFRVRGGTRQGSCDVVLWLPGNLNAEWPLRFEVAGRARAGYTRAGAEFVTERLYEALLGRAPDPTGLADHTARIQGGDLAGAINSILGSVEFRNHTAGATPALMLERIYQGLLGRPPDTLGVRTWLGAAERGRYGEIVWELLRSDEFEGRLLRATGGR